MKTIFDKMNINALSMGLTVAGKKNEVIARNIANVDTPNYKAQDMDFDTVMKDFTGQGKKLPLTQTDDQHLPQYDLPFEPSDYIYRQNNPSLRNDGNDVNLDYEMSSMAKNSVMYQALTTFTTHEFTKLKTAIQSR